MDIGRCCWRVVTSSPLRRRCAASAPATCGAAMDVPESVELHESELAHPDLMPDPGAKMATQLP